ncbi:MAG TPA: cadherin repeat domain-containing protein [Edaphobacter sp.]
MKSSALLPLCTAGALAAFTLLAGSQANAQSCSLPAVPDGTITTTQDRDQMLCQQRLKLPTLPTRQGTAWPWNDPTAPTNAWPKDLSAPEGNWTDAQSHTIVRTAWGNWHTYDSDPAYEPSPSVHYPDPSILTGSLNGGAMSGVGTYGPDTPGYELLPVLKFDNGRTVKHREDWWLKRRPEIFNNVQGELYGETLINFKPNITWTVGPTTTGTQVGSDGATYTYRDKVFTGVVDVSAYPALRNVPQIVMDCRFPEATGKKYPSIVHFGANNTFQYTAPYGYGSCGYSNALVAPDSGGANLSSYVIGLKNHGGWRKPDDAGALVEWAWGISRFIDYLESSNDADVDADKIGVEGHSRYGKATLVAAAYDQRIVVALPSCGGALGTAPARRAYGETLDFVTSSTSEYHWVSGRSMTYAGPIHPYDGNPAHTFPRKVKYLDVDAYSTLSLIAPRAVMTNGGTDTPQGNGDAWQDPTGMYLTGKFGSPAWEFLGWPGQVIPQGTPFTSPGSPGPRTCVNCGPAEAVNGTPPYDVAFTEGTVAYRRHSQGHTDTPDWPTFAQWSARYLNDGRPVITPGQSFTLGEAPAGTVGKVDATDPDTDPLQQWQVKGGTGAYKFTIDPDTGEIEIADAKEIDFLRASSYTLTLMTGDGKLPSHDETVTINIPNKINVCQLGINLQVPRLLTGILVAQGAEIGKCDRDHGHGHDGHDHDGPGDGHDGPGHGGPGWGW